MPASRRASKPAADGQQVVLSSAADRSGVDAELADGSNAWARAASLMTSAASSMVSKRPLPSLALTRRVMCWSRIASRMSAGIGLDELLAVQQAAEVGRVEEVLGAGQARGRAGDDDRPFATAADPTRPSAAVRSTNSATIRPSSAYRSGGITPTRRPVAAARIQRPNAGRCAAASRRRGRLRTRRRLLMRWCSRGRRRTARTGPG